MDHSELNSKIEALNAQIEQTTGQLNQLLGYKKALVDLVQEQDETPEDNTD